jgi:hypothetical protein
MAKGANLSKGKLFGAVADLKTGLAEFNHPLDQSSQARVINGSPCLSLMNEGNISLSTHYGSTCISTKNYFF